MTLQGWFRSTGTLVLAGALVLMGGCRNQKESEAGSGSDAPPQIGAVTPAAGEGRSQIFRFVASHPDGAEAIGDLEVLFDAKMSPTGAGSCWIDVNSFKNVAARKDDGSVWLPYAAIGSSAEAGNSQCSVDASGVKVELKGQEAAVTLPVKFNPAFTGMKKVWVVASGPRKHSGWQERGTWAVK